MLAPLKPIEPVTGLTQDKAAKKPVRTRRRWSFIRPLGFSLRLNLWYTASFVIGAFLLFTLAYVLLNRQLTAHDHEIVRAKLDVYRAWYVQDGAPALQLHFKDESDWTKATTFLEVRSTSQQLVFDQTLGNPQVKARLSPLPPNLVGNDTDWITLPATAQNVGWDIASSRLPDGCIMHVGRTTEDREEILRRFRTIYLFAIIPVVALGFCGGAFITHRALNPIRAIIGAVRTIIETGDMGAHVPEPHTEDEINELVTLFNRMLTHNEALIGAMRDSLDNVAHDFRTPLTRLQGGAQLALQHDDPSQIKEALADAVEEAERLNAMLCTIMDISEVEAGALRLDLETFPLEPIITLLVELYDDVAQDKNITVIARIDPAGQVTADRNRLQLFLSNLIDNAIKYTPDGGRVEIGATFAPLETRITVRDSGIGIDPDDMPHIWDRLYRGDKSRSQRGIGLGLSLVKAFVEAHGGTVTVDSTPGEGSLFTVTLPRAK